MQLSTLNLTNFRSYKKKSLAISPQTTIIIGPNTAGKTNILEAIYLLSTGKSFRAETEREMIRYDEEMARVRGELTNIPIDKYANKHIEKTALEIVLTNGEVQGQKASHKKYLVDGAAKRMVDFVGNLRAVVFWPQDLELITSSPSRRRKYLDGVLAQIDWEYRRTLESYEKGLRSRNRLLQRIRDEGATRSQLLFWDQLLIRHGGYLTNKREEFISFINQEKREIDSSAMEIIYDHSLISEARLAQYKEAEVVSGTTLVGPHRDDFVVVVQVDEGNKGDKGAKENRGRDLHIYGSRGEQRLAVLWLKLAELNYIEVKTKDRPILLLDDIFSELDHSHRAIVFQEVPKQQTIVTMTDEHFIEDKIEKAQVITLGQLSSRGK